MNFELIFSILLQIAALGCIFLILFWIFNLVEAKVPEPFKQVVGWLRLFVLICLGIYAIFFIADLAGINTGGHGHLLIRKD